MLVMRAGAAKVRLDELAFSHDGTGLLAPALSAGLCYWPSLASGAKSEMLSLPAKVVRHLAVSPDGQAIVTMVAGVDTTRNQVLAAPLAAGATAFGPAETVSAALPFLHQPSAAFDRRIGQFVVAWQVPPQGEQPNRVEVSQRPAP